MQTMDRVEQKDVQKEVREYVVDNFLLDEGEDELSDDDSFLESGLIDSTGILEVIMFLEERYEVAVEDDEMIPENLDSIARIATFVVSKLEA